MHVIRTFQRYITDKSASVLPIFATLILPITIIIGAAVDYTLTSRNQAKIVNVTDAAILTAAAKVQNSADLSNKSSIEASLKEEINAFLKANMANYDGPDYKISEVNYNPKTKDIELSVKHSHPTSFMRIVGIDEIEGTVETATAMGVERQNSVSMVLVLDKSGSMAAGVHSKGGESRLSVLKKAVSTLASELEQQDPDHKYVRTGAIAYDSHIASQQKMDWGAFHVSNFTNRLRAGGGTRSVYAMNKAIYHYLEKDREEREHAKQNSGELERYVVFMTDGAHGRRWDDTLTLRTCRAGKYRGITIYTVAFRAPRRGQNLLKACATTSKHYYEAENSRELISIFKNIGERAARNLTLKK